MDLGWILSGFGILGAFLNIRKSRLCFPVWCIGNAGWLVVSVVEPAMRTQIPLWIAFIALNVWGFLRWKDERLLNCMGRSKNEKSSAV